MNNTEALRLILGVSVIAGAVMYGSYLQKKVYEEQKDKYEKCLKTEFNKIECSFKSVFGGD